MAKLVDDRRYEWDTIDHQWAIRRNLVNPSIMYIGHIHDNKVAAICCVLFHKVYYVEKCDYCGIDNVPEHLKVLARLLI